VLASTLLASTATSFAEEGKSFRYGIEGNNLVFKSPAEAISGGSVRLAVKGGQNATISVELVDVFSDESGTKRSIPLDSSPFTPKGLVQFKKSYPVYEPSEEFQYFDIEFNFKEDAVLDRPVLGGLSISLVPEAESTEQTAVQSSIVATFAYLPASGLNLEEYAPALSLQGPTIERRTPDFFPLNLFPNPPFALNHGDLKLSYELENTGKIFLETSTQVKVERLSLLGQLEAEVFTKTTEAFLVPGQKTQPTVEIVPPDIANAELAIGIYRFTTTATGEIGNLIETSTSNQQTLIIFPWKQSLLAILLLVLLRRRIARAFNWLLGYAKALRDFRYQTDPSPALTAGPTMTPIPPVATESRDTSASRVATESRATPASIVTTGNNQITDPKPEISSTQKLTAPKPTIKPLREVATPIPKPPMPRTSETRPLYPFWYEPPKKDNNS
jgi:hypothetical protein